MSSKANTRRALFTSIMSLLLCVSMLVGTTFAWFTDSVVSGMNQIISGTLDVDVYYGDPADENSIQDVTTLFNDVTLWEPGVVAWENLTVVNLGNLALKYQLSINFANENTVNGNGLSSALQVAVVPGGVTTTTREEVLDEADAAGWQTLASFAKEGKLLPDGYTGPAVPDADEEATTYGLVIWWEPKTNDNDWNVNNGKSTSDGADHLHIDLGVQVLATQLEAELDSFDNKYDEGLDLPTTAAAVVRPDGGVSLSAVNAPAVDTKLTTVDAPAGTFDAGKKVEITVDSENSLFQVTKDGEVVGNLDVVLTVDGVQQTTELTSGAYTVTTYISKGLTDVSVKYTGTDGRAQPTFVSYDSVTGKLVFTTTHFSEYAVSGKALAYDLANDTGLNDVDKIIENIDTVVVPEDNKEHVYTEIDKIESDAANEALKALSSASVNGTPYLTAKEAFAASAAGDTVALKQGSYKFADCKIKAGVTVEGEEGVIFTDTLSGTLDNVTIKNVDIVAGNTQRWAYAHGTLVFENCTFNATSVYAIHYDGLNGANITYKNCDITGWVAIGGGAEYITFDGCTIKGNGAYGLIRLYSNGTIKNCTFDVSAVNTTDVYQDGIHAVDCVINVENVTNVNGETADLFNVSGSAVILHGDKAYVKDAAGLAQAVAKGATDIYLADGEYDVNNCGGKTLTINGSKNAVLKVMNEGEDGCDYGFGSGGAGVGNVTFNGVTIDTTGNNGNYKGYAYLNATFNDCDFVGAYTSHWVQTYNNCHFDFKNGYFWIWGAEEVTFNNCEFGGNSKNILAHGWASSVININDCTFAATEKGYTGGGDWTAAVEIDPAGSNTYKINFTGENTLSENYSGWTRVKDGSTGHTITGLN